jgi:hypothetical protein
MRETIIEINKVWPKMPILSFVFHMQPSEIKDLDVAEFWSWVREAEAILRSYASFRVRGI